MLFFYEKNLFGIYEICLRCEIAYAVSGIKGKFTEISKTVSPVFLLKLILLLLKALIYCIMNLIYNEKEFYYVSCCQNN